MRIYGKFQSSNFLLSRRYFFLSPWKFSLSSEKVFITKFVTSVTNFVIHISNFVICVTNFVTNFFCADSEKYKADRKKYLGGNKKISWWKWRPDSIQEEPCYKCGLRVRGGLKLQPAKNKRGCANYGTPSWNGVGARVANASYVFWQSFFYLSFFPNTEKCT